jgi:hypothetical protein
VDWIHLAQDTDQWWDFLSTTPWRHIWRVEVKLHAFYDLGTRWRWVATFTPRSLCPQGKSPRYPLDRRLRGPQSRSEHGVEGKNSQPMPGFEPRPSDCPARSQSPGLKQLSYLMFQNTVYKNNRVEIRK